MPCGHIDDPDEYTEEDWRMIRQNARAIQDALERTMAQERMRTSLIRRAWEAVKSWRPGSRRD